MKEVSDKLSNKLTTRSGKTFVFTNGCFDILHRGHVEYLNEAKGLGDFLIVALNSDESVQKLKGPKRPIISQEDRKYILENLACVDFVEIFNDDNPVNLITLIRPDIYVKGGDYEIEKIPEYNVVKGYGGKVKKLTFVQGPSTTNIVNKILSSK